MAVHANSMQGSKKFIEGYNCIKIGSLSHVIRTSIDTHYQCFFCTHLAPLFPFLLRIYQD